MEDDNLMPNDGTFFGGVPLEPLEQILDRKKERAKTLEAKKELEKVIAHLSDRIEATDSIKQALVLAKTHDISRGQAIVVLDIVRQQLEMEKELIKELLEIHT